MVQRSTVLHYEIVMTTILQRLNCSRRTCL